MFFISIKRKNEFLQRGPKPDDKQIEKQRNNKLCLHGKEGDCLQFSLWLCVVIYPFYTITFYSSLSAYLQLNPWTYTQSHTPTVVQREGGIKPPSQGFVGTEK